MHHYTLSSEDRALIRERRRAANRLGFAVNLAYMRYPARVLGVEELRPQTCSPSSRRKLAALQRTSAVTPSVARQSGWEGGDGQECILTVAAD